MITLFYSKGQILHLSTHSEEYKLVFYEYDYKFSKEKIEELIKGGHFAFVNLQNRSPVTIQMSPQYNAVINKKNICYAEINETIIGDTQFEYVKTTIKISNSTPEFGVTDFTQYIEKCHKFINM